MSSELLFDHEHGDVGLALFALADDAANDFVVVVRHDGEVGKLSDEVVVGEYGVGLCELGADDVRHPVELVFAAELPKRQQGFIKALHLKSFNYG